MGWEPQGVEKVVPPIRIDCRESRERQYRAIIATEVEFGPVSTRMELGTYTGPERELARNRLKPRNK